MDIETRVAALEARELRLRSALIHILFKLVSADIAAAGAGVSLAKRDYERASKRLDELSSHHDELRKIIAEELQDE